MYPEITELSVDYNQFVTLKALDEEGNDIAVAQGAFENFGSLQKALEEKGVHIISSGFERFPLSYMKVNAEQEIDIQKMIDKMEEDDDVNMVYHNMIVE